MRVICHDRLSLIFWRYTTLMGVLIWFMAAVAPPAAHAGEPPLGLATGAKEAQMAIDGKRWATLSASSNPVYDGAMMRTGKGTASVLLKDGTQLEVRPHTLIALSGSRTAPVVKIALGQAFFRVPSASRIAFVTPTVRYQTEDGNIANRPTVLKAKATTASAADAVGKISVNKHGGSRIGLQQGTMFARSVGDPGLHIVKAGQSVYIPQIGAPDPGFGVMLAQALPGDTTTNLPDNTNPVYGADGKSLGYISSDDSLVWSPGTAGDLTTFSPGQIPSDVTMPPDAIPAFDSDGVYAGYFTRDHLGVVYVPESAPFVEIAGAAAGGLFGGAGTAAGVGVGAAAIGAGAAVATNNSGKATPSTP